MRSSSPQPAGPQALFVLASHGALEIRAPCLRIGIEIQRLERNLDLGRPAEAGAPHAREPDAVPRLVRVVVAGRSGDQAIAHRARRVDLEEVSRPPVEKRIDRPHEAIVRRERLVALHLVAQQLSRLGIEAGDAENDPVLVEDESGPRFSRSPVRRCRGRAGESPSRARPSATPPRRVRRRGRSIRPRPVDAPGPPAGALCAAALQPHHTTHRSTAQRRESTVLTQASTSMTLAWHAIR